MNMKLKRLFITGIVCTSMLLISGGCTNSNSDKASPLEPQVVSENETAKKIKEGGKVVVAVPQDPDFLDPHKAVASGTQEMMFNVFEGLLKADDKGSLVTAVAEKYSISEDGLTYTFTLRKGVKFHNGDPVTIEDVKYSFDRLMGVGTDTPLSSAFKAVESVETPDDQTIVFKLKQINASFLVNFTQAILPKDVEDPNKNPIGTGPFKFVEYIPSQRVVIKKFDGYWQQGIPKLDEVEFRIMDSQAALMSLQAGEIDMFPRIANEQVELLGDQFKVIRGMQNMVQLMTMNFKEEPFSDIKVRKAINYAIDTDEIIEAVALGYGTKLGSNMSPVVANYYQEGLENIYDQNIEKAKGLLKEAGYENGFKTTITVPSNYKFHVDTAQVIANQLEKAGITAEIEQVEWSVWLERVYQGRDYKMTIIGLTGKLDPHQDLMRYESSYPSNFFNYSNSKYDELIAQALLEVDAAKRAALYKEAQRILSEDAAAVYIMDPNFTVALKKNLDGYKLYPIYVQDMAAMYYTE